MEEEIGCWQQRCLHSAVLTKDLQAKRRQLVYTQCPLHYLLTPSPSFIGFEPHLRATQSFKKERTTKSGLPDTTLRFCPDHQRLRSSFLSLRSHLDLKKRNTRRPCEIGFDLVDLILSIGPYELEAPMPQSRWTRT